MVNLELYNIVQEVKQVSKAFVVLPKNVNAENAASMVFFCFNGCFARKLLNPESDDLVLVICSFTGYVVFQITSGDGN